MKRLQTSLEKPNDIVVTTPGILSKLKEKNYIFYSGLQYLVIDESDTLLKKGFEEDTTENILLPAKNILKSNQKVQFVFSLATYSKEVQSFVDKEFPVF